MSTFIELIKQDTTHLMLINRKTKEILNGNKMITLSKKSNIYTSESAIGVHTREEDVEILNISHEPIDSDRKDIHENEAISVC